MKRKYKVKITPKLLKVLKKYWKAYKILDEHYHWNLRCLEEKMEKETGIKDIEFFRSIPKQCPFCRKELLIDPSVCGIGDYGLWAMPLIQREKLEKQ